MGQGPGICSGFNEHDPQLLSQKRKDKQNQHIFLVVQCLIPCLLIAYTQQLDILRSNQENHTPEIFLECYCVTRKKPIGCEKSKPQTKMLINLRFCGQCTCLNLCCDWS